MNKLAKQNAQSSAWADTFRSCEAGFGHLLELIPVAVYVCDRDGLIIQHNPAAVSLWGRAPRPGDGGERFCGSFKIFRPDGSSLPHERCPMAETLRTGQPIRNTEIVIERPDGSRATAIVNTTPIKNDRGEMIGAINSLLEITERKRAELALLQSEQRHRAVLESALDAIITMDHRGQIVEFNPAAERMFGHSRSAAIGHDMAELIIPAALRERHRAGLARFLASGEGPGLNRRLEFSALGSDGLEFPIELSIVRVVQSDPPVFIGFIRDITERKRRDRQLAALASLGRRLNATKDIISAGRIIVEVADELLGWDACSLILYDSTTDQCRPVFNMDLVGGVKVDVPFAYTAKPPSPCLRKVIEAGAELILRESTPGWTPDLVPFGDTSRPSASLMFAPVRDGQQIIGVVSIQSYRAHAYTRKELDTLQALADHCGGALERIQGRERLEEKHNLLQTVMNHLVEAQALAKVGSWETELPSQNVTWSEETYRIFESDPLHFHPTHARFLAFIHPEDRPKVDAAFMRSLDHRSPCLLEHRIVMPNGRVKFVEERWQTFADEHGRPVRAAGTCQDITERRRAEAQLRESEERFAKVFHASPVAIVITTQAEGRYVDVNEFFLEMFGHRREEVIGRTALELGVWAEPAQRAAIMDTLHTGRQVRDVECQFRIKSGALRTALVSVEMIRLGDTPCWLFLNHDITDRKDTQAELSQSLELLRNLAAHVQAAREEERSRISREVHDELGQMMTVLRMELTWLAGKLPPELTLLSDKTRQMKKLVEQVASTVSRIAMDLRPSVLDDLGLVPALEWQAEEFQARTGIACRLVSDTENLPLDAERATAVFRIFQEALTNVTRHANASRVEAWLRTQGRMLMLEVQDNGRGISPQEIAGTRSLGLVGMRERAALLGGTIRITGEAGKGTNLELTLPAQATSSPT